MRNANLPKIADVDRQAKEALATPIKRSLARALEEAPMMYCPYRRWSRTREYWRYGYAVAACGRSPVDMLEVVRGAANRDALRAGYNYGLQVARHCQ
jgi:hypothetical protein